MNRGCAYAVWDNGVVLWKNASAIGVVATNFPRFPHDHFALQNLELANPFRILPTVTNNGRCHIIRSNIAVGFQKRIKVLTGIWCHCVYTLRYREEHGIALESDPFDIRSENNAIMVWVVLVNMPDDAHSESFSLVDVSQLLFPQTEYLIRWITLTKDDGQNWH